MTRMLPGLVCALALGGAACLSGDDDGGGDNNGRPDAGGTGADGNTNTGAPTANAGADVTAFSLADVQLDGSGSTDPDGDALTFAWTQTAGDAVALVDADTATPRFGAPSATGTLTFELSVSDGTSAATDTVDVVVQTFAGEVPTGGDESPFAPPRNLLTQGRELVAQGRYLYVADSAAGLRILDAADPAAPIRAAVSNTPGTAMGVALAGNHAYVADLTQGLQIIDVRDYLAEVADPAAPQLVGSAALVGNAFSVAVAGNYAFVANTTGLAIVDVSAFIADAADPVATLVTQVTTPGFAFDVVIDGNFAYVSDRADGVGAGQGGLRIFDITAYVAGTPDPADPPNVGNWTDHGVYAAAVTGNYAFVAQNDTNSLDSGGFLRIIDITDKAAPAEVDGTALDTASTPSGVKLIGNELYVRSPRNIEVVDVADYVAGTPGTTPPRSIIAFPTRSLSQGFDRIGDYGYSSEFGGDLIPMHMADFANPQGLGRLSNTADASDLELAGDYAFVGFGNDFVLCIDISDPAAPSLPAGGTITAVAGGAALAVAGDHLFVAGSLPLEVVDIGAFIAGADATTPEIVATLDEWPQSTSDVVVSDGVAYMPIPLNGVQLVDVSTPASPSVPVGGSAGMYTRGSVTDIAVEGTRMYVAGTTGVEVVDVSDPAAPASLGADTSFGFAGGVAVRDGIVYVGASNNGLIVVDMTDPTAPVRLGSLRIGTGVSRVVLDGDVAFVATGPIQKVAAVDIRSPSQLAVLAAYGPTSSVTGLRPRDGVVHVSGFGGYESFRMGSAALVGAPGTASPGADVTMTLVWTDATNDLDVACQAPAGSTCAVTDHDRTANTATVTWTVPTAPGDYAVRAAVGNSVGFTNALGRVRVE